MEDLVAKETSSSKGSGSGHQTNSCSPRHQSNAVSDNKRGKNKKKKKRHKRKSQHRSAGSGGTGKGRGLLSFELGDIRADGDSSHPTKKIRIKRCSDTAHVHGPLERQQTQKRCG